MHNSSDYYEYDAFAWDMKSETEILGVEKTAIRALKDAFELEKLHFEEEKTEMQKQHMDCKNVWVWKLVMLGGVS